MKHRRLLTMLFAGAAGAATGLAAAMLPKRPTPAERERARRLSVQARGRTGNALVTDVKDAVLTYTYEVGGIEYTASQDLAGFAELLPTDPSTLINRPAIIKYLGANPANSILVCEEWSGLLFQPQAGDSESVER